MVDPLAARRAVGKSVKPSRRNSALDDRQQLARIVDAVVTWVTQRTDDLG
jgi:hypothetical protein